MSAGPEELESSASASTPAPSKRRYEQSVADRIEEASARLAQVPVEEDLSHEERERLLEEWALAQEKAWEETNMQATQAVAEPEPVAETEPVSVADPPAPESPPISSNKVPHLNWPMLAGAAALLFGAGFASGTLLWQLSSAPVHIQEESRQDNDTNVSRAQVDTAPRRVSESGMIDTMILEGRYENALEACRALSPGLSRATPALRYRAALCLEALGKREDAGLLYRSLLTGDSATCSCIAAQLGLMCLAGPARIQDSRTVRRCSAQGDGTPVARPALCAAPPASRGQHFRRRH
jgi:hypothetical protein